jgi:hypothetical protein
MLFEVGVGKSSSDIHFLFLHQAADEPAYLTVGTDVSAKYRGAFCEAKIKTVKRLVKVKVIYLYTFSCNSFINWVEEIVVLLSGEEITILHESTVIHSTYRNIL